jgi:hypothetical protein
MAIEDKGAVLFHNPEVRTMSTSPDANPPCKALRVVFLFEEYGSRMSTTAAPQIPPDDDLGTASLSKISPAEVIAPEITAEPSPFR